MVRRLVYSAKGHQRKFVQPLEAGVIYGETGDGPFVILSFDLCEEGYPFMDSIHAPLVQKLGIPAGRILILYTHAHMSGKYDIPKLQGIVLVAVAAAKAGQVEAETGVLNLSVNSRAFVINRRVTVPGIGTHTLIFNDGCTVSEGAFDATGQVRQWIEDLGVNAAGYVRPGQRFIPSGETDDSLQVLFFRDQNTKRVIGSFTRFACHPVIVSMLRVQGDLSADYPGYLKKKLEDAVGGTALFGQGPSGELKPLNPEYSHAYARKFGERLADFILADFKNVAWKPLHRIGFATAPAVLRLRPDLVPDAAAADQEIARVEAAYDKTADPAERRRLQNRFRLCCYVRDDFTHILRPEWKQKNQVEITLTAVRFNDTVVIASPGEVFMPTGREILRPFTAQSPIMVSVCNENISYLVPPEEFEQGGYEPGVCIVDPPALSNLVQAAHGLLNRIYD
jgi:hypothetical protein